MLIIPHSTQGRWENINSYFLEEVSPGERSNKLWKFVPKTSVGGSLKPQSNQVQLLHTLTPVMDSRLPLGNVSELSLYWALSLHGYADLIIPVQVRNDRLTMESNWNSSLRLHLWIVLLKSNLLIQVVTSKINQRGQILQLVFIMQQGGPVVAAGAGALAPWRGGDDGSSMKAVFAY